MIEANRHQWLFLKHILPLPQGPTPLSSDQKSDLSNDLIFLKKFEVEISLI